jgi:4-hydroxythreonine-4-phosphate dehydrogenase
MTDAKPVLGVFLGDASGCGPELVAKIAANGALTAACRPLLIGDARVFARAQTYTGTSVKTRLFASPGEAHWDDDGDGIPFYDMKNLDPAQFRLAEPNALCGRATIDGLTLAAQICLAGKTDGVLYAPIHKQAIGLADEHCKSEIDIFLRAMPGTGYHGEINILGDLWTTRVTSHIPLKDVSAALTKEGIVEAIHFGEGMLRRAGFATPRLAVAALNPHAGENGHCGREELDVIAPAVEAAAKAGVNVQGPFPADTVFDRAFGGEFDMVVTLYHDQGQIALKTRGFRAGVTVSGGFPIPLVTPAHGTAFTTAGKGTADEGAITCALAVASRMAAQLRQSR